MVETRGVVTVVKLPLDSLFLIQDDTDLTNSSVIHSEVILLNQTNWI